MNQIPKAIPGVNPGALEGIRSSKSVGGDFGNSFEASVQLIMKDCGYKNYFWHERRRNWEHDNFYERQI